MIYVIDTNIISDVLRKHENVTQHLWQAVSGGHEVFLCPPVVYEVMRGLLKTDAKKQHAIFQNTIQPILDEVTLIDADGQQAAQYWADATRRGRQFSDVDLLVAAVATRLEGVIASSDGDFDALSVQRVNWREASG